jgi:hypothetical protein
VTIRDYAVLVSSALLLAGAGCGGGAPASRDIPPGTSLEDSLPLLVPTAEEYGLLLEDWGELDVFVHTNGVRTNEDLVAELPGELLAAPGDTSPIGRQTGYLAGYSAGRRASAGMQDFSCCAARFAIDLYADEDSARRRLETSPPYATSFHPRGIGSDAVAWLVAQSDTERVCPCELWFRVGPFVGAVVTSYHGPFPSHLGESLDPIQEQLARLMAERMGAALAAS